MKDGGQNATTGGCRQRFRNALVVVEMALAVVLLVGAGLMLRSSVVAAARAIGFNPAGVLTMRMSLPAASYAAPEQVVAFYQRLTRSRPAAAGRHDRRRGALAAARIDDRRLRPRWSTATSRRPGRARRATGRSSPTVTSRRSANGSCAAAASRRPTRATPSSWRSSTRRWRAATWPAAIRSAGASASAAATRIVRGSPSSASSRTSGTTASRTSSRRSSTFRTRSGTSRSGIRSAR